MGNTFGPRCLAQCGPICCAECVHPSTFEPPEHADGHARSSSSCSSRPDKVPPPRRRGAGAAAPRPARRGVGRGPLAASRPTCNSWEESHIAILRSPAGSRSGSPPPHRCGVKVFATLNSASIAEAPKAPPARSAAEELMLDPEMEKELAGEVELWRMETSSAEFHRYVKSNIVQYTGLRGAKERERGRSFERKKRTQRRSSPPPAVVSRKVPLATNAVRQQRVPDRSLSPPLRKQVSLHDRVGPLDLEQLAAARSAAKAAVNAGSEAAAAAPPATQSAANAEVEPTAGSLPQSTASDGPASAAPPASSVPPLQVTGQAGQESEADAAAGARTKAVAAEGGAAFDGDVAAGGPRVETLDPPPAAAKIGENPVKESSDPVLPPEADSDPKSETDVPEPMDDEIVPIDIDDARRMSAASSSSSSSSSSSFAGFLEDPTEGARTAPRPARVVPPVFQWNAGGLGVTSSLGLAMAMSKGASGAPTTASSSASVPVSSSSVPGRSPNCCSSGPGLGLAPSGAVGLGSGSGAPCIVGVSSPMSPSACGVPIAMVGNSMVSGGRSSRPVRAFTEPESDDEVPLWGSVQGDRAAF